MSSVSFLAGHAEAVVLSTFEGWLQEEARRKGCKIQVRDVVHACTTPHSNFSVLKVMTARVLDASVTRALHPGTLGEGHSEG